MIDLRIKTPHLPIKHIREEFRTAKEKGDLVKMEKMFFALIWQYNRQKKQNVIKIKKILQARKTEVDLK